MDAHVQGSSVKQESGQSNAAALVQFHVQLQERFGLLSLGYLSQKNFKAQKL